MSSKSKVKPLEDGKLSFALPSDLREIILQVIHRRIQNEKDELEHHTYFALLEAHSRILRQMAKKRMSLLCSHFYVVFSSDTMVYIDQGTQNLISAHLQDFSSSPPRLNDFKLRYDDYGPDESQSTYPHDWSEHYVPMTENEDIPI